MILFLSIFLIYVREQILMKIIFNNVVEEFLMELLNYYRRTILNVYSNIIKEQFFLFWCVFFIEKKLNISLYKGSSNNI